MHMLMHALAEEAPGRLTCSVPWQVCWWHNRWLLVTMELHSCTITLQCVCKSNATSVIGILDAHYSHIVLYAGGMHDDVVGPSPLIVMDSPHRTVGAKRHMRSAMLIV